MAMLGSVVADRYRLDRRLGAGGMSTVYVALDTVLEREVAAKLLAEHLAEDEAFVARFRREALAAAKLIHPNIVQVYDSGQDRESHRHYIVMEYVQGRSVADILREKRHLSVAEAAEIVTQACDGLAYAHRHGVIHRDVKPGNLIINGEDVVKLADFGIAKAAEDSQITQIGSVLGTAAYLSPERARGEEATPRSDVYSLGVVLYQLLSGQVPFETGSLTELALRQQEGPPPLVSSLNGAVGPELDRAVSRCLASDPAGRYATASEMREAVEEAARGRDAAVTVALEAAMVGSEGAPTTVTRHLPAYDRVAEPSPPAAEPVLVDRRPPPTSYPPREVAPRRRRGVGGTFARFLALLFLFLLIATIAAAVVVLTSNGSQAQDFERVARDTIDQQVNGLRLLIDKATGG